MSSTASETSSPTHDSSSPSTPPSSTADRVANDTQSTQQMLSDIASRNDDNKLNGDAPVEQPRPTSKSNGKTVVNDVLRRLEALIINDDWQHEENAADATGKSNRRTRYEAPRLSELSRSIVTSYSLRAYVDLLAHDHKHGVAHWLYSSTNATLANMFRFADCDTHVDANGYEGGVKHACHLALRERYGDKLASDGFEAFTGNAPVVYLSPALRLANAAEMIRSECGVKDVVAAPRFAGPLSDVEGRIDHLALATRMQEDTAAGRRPLLVVATVGSSVFGQNDLITKLLELRETHKFWLHVVGNGLAALACSKPPEHLVKILQRCDSLSLSVGQWLGIAPLTTVTLHRSIEQCPPSYTQEMDCLPLWVALNCITPPRIALALDAHFLLNKTMVQELCRFERIQIMGVPDANDYADKVQRGVIMAPCVLVFKYVNEEEGDTKEGKAVEAEAAAVDREYVDCLNSWIGQGLLTDCTHMGLHFIELGHGLGTALRFCPLETASFYETSTQHIRHFAKQLSDVLNIVDATVRARRHLSTMLAEQTPKLRLMRVAKWAGAGAVCYVPSIVDTATEWTESQRQQVSHMNLELVHSLRSSDSAFSTGESVEGIACVKFGMLADERDLTDLVRLVAQRGHDIEQSSQYLESLAELVRQGIDAANDELKRENDEKLMQEGVMRQLPMVGSFINWWSPMSPEHSHITGRSFDLKTGRIASTRITTSVDGDRNSAPQQPHASMSHVEGEEENNNGKAVVENGGVQNEEETEAQK